MTYRIFIDCRWYAQPGQGVVTYLDGLHEAAEKKLQSRSDSSRIEFWYGVEDASTLPPGLHLPAERVLAYGRRSMLWRLFAFPFFLKRHGFHAAHFTYVCPIPSLGVSRITSIHDVLYLRYPQFFSFGHRILRKILYGLSARRSEIVLTISEQSQRDIVELLGRRKPIEIIPCGPSGPTRMPGEIGGGKSVAGLERHQFILTVGRVEPRKNYPRLVQSFLGSGLADKGAKLVIVGFCPAEFERELAHIRNRNGVMWLDRVSDEDLTWLYGNARAFIYPSHCEGFGIPVIEAMQAGLPIGVSETYPLADVVELADRRFDPYDSASIARALSDLWTMTLESLVPKEVLLRRYNWEVAATSYLRILENTLVAESR